MEYVIIGKFMKGTCTCSNPKCHKNIDIETMQSPVSFAKGREETEALNMINREDLPEYEGPFYILKVIGIIPQGEAKAKPYDKFHT